MSLTTAWAQPRRATVAAGSLLEIFAELHSLAANLGTLAEADQAAALGEFAGEIAPLTRTLWEAEQAGGEAAAARGRLARLVAGRVDLAPITAARIAEERGLTEGLQEAPLPEQFDRLGRLAGLYLRSFRIGGGVGRLWVHESRKRLVERIPREHLYHLFLRQSPDGTSLLTLPSEARRPSGLKFQALPSEPRAVWIPGKEPFMPGAVAYFRLADLVTPQRVVSDERVAFFERLLEAEDDFRDPVSIVYDPGQDRFILWEGNNRSVAVLRKRFPYILGRIQYRFGHVGEVRRIDQTEVVPHAVYLKEIVEPRGNEGNPHAAELHDPIAAAGIAVDPAIGVSVAVRLALAKGPDAMRGLLAQTPPTGSIDLRQPPSHPLDFADPLLALLIAWSDAIVSPDRTLSEAAIGAWDEIIGPMLRPPSEDLRAVVATGFASVGNLFYRADGTVDEIEGVYRERFADFRASIDLSRGSSLKHRLLLIKLPPGGPQGALIVFVREFMHNLERLIHTQEWQVQNDGRVYPLWEDVRAALIPVEVD